jgi:hydrogenase maturation protein HypF
MREFVHALERYQALFRIEPEAVAHDLHPDLLTTRFAEDLDLPTFPVQHHHAHIVSTMAENGLEGEVLGVAFDGFGLGDDGTAWGGEFLACRWSDYRRVGRLRRVPQPGGDAATRNPVRMALSHALDAGVLDEALPLLALANGETDVILRQLATGFASPLTSSAGRLFDAIAALIGVCRRSTFDGQAAMLLEQAATTAPVAAPTGSEIDVAAEGVVELDTRPLVAGAVRDLASGLAPAVVSARFHSGFAEAISVVAGRTCADQGLDRVVLGGGVFSNRILVDDLSARLARMGLRVFAPTEVPVGDGGIALGQALVAAARMEAI